MRTVQEKLAVLHMNQFIDKYRDEWKNYTCHSIDNKNNPTISSSDYAWAAGILDGEGSIGVYYNKNKHSSHYYATLRISQSSDDGIPEMLIRFMNIVKVGKIHDQYRTFKNKNWKPHYQYQAYNNDVYKIVQLLWPHLGDVKRQQAINAGFRPE